MIVAMPAGHIRATFNCGPFRTRWAIDKFNEDLTGRVISFMDKNYRTVSDHDHRALAGLSIDGLQTLDISLSLSVGSVCVCRCVQFRLVLGRTDLAHYKASGQPFKLYWVGVRKYDIANANSAATVVLLRKYGVAPTTKETGGYHAWTNWRDYLPDFAAEIFRYCLGRSLAASCRVRLDL